MTQPDLNLSAAQARLHAAQANLASAESALARAHAVEDLRRREAESATAAELSASVDDVLQLAAARRDSETILGAATRSVAAAKRTRDAANAELKSAKRAEQECRNVVLTIEGEAEADKLARDEAVVATRRARLTALRDFPGFIASPKIARAIADDVHTRLCDIEPSGELNTPMNLLGMVQSAEDGQAYWSQCLEARSQIAQHESESFVEVRSVTAA